MNRGPIPLVRTKIPPYSAGQPSSLSFNDAERLHLLVVRAEYERVEADLACARYAATLAEIELLENGNTTAVSQVIRTLNLPGGALANATQRYMAVPVEALRAA